MAGLLTMKDGAQRMRNKAAVAIVNLPLFFGICLEVNRAMKNLRTGML
jgi:hypothetical protein